MPILPGNTAFSFILFFYYRRACMATIIQNKETTTTINENGEERTVVKETTKNIERNNEPDYIKIYTKMWCEFNQIPEAYREFFLQLAIRMTYCDITDKGQHGGQLVNTGKPWNESIMQALGWKKAMYQKALKKLCECKAISKVSRGVYQINPSYAAKGEWKYNPKLQRGGIEDLITTFKFKDKTVETKVIWSDDSKNNDINDTYRKGLNTKPEDNTVLKEIVIKPKNQDACSDFYSDNLTPINTL